MGRLIDEGLLQEKLALIPMEERTFRRTIEELENAPTVEAIPKDQYEARLKKNNELINDLEELRTMINKFAESYESRLKADMVAMLDKIRAEINQLTSRYTISRERGCMGQVEWEDRLIREVDILQIIDKYKAEAEDT